MENTNNQQQIIDKEFENRLLFDRLITELSARFINLPANQIDQQINNGLKSVVKALKVDRSTLFQLSEDGEEMLVTHSYAKKGFEPTPRVEIQKDFPWLASKLMCGEAVEIASLNDLPKQAATDSKSLALIHIKSTLVLPVSIAETIKYILAIGRLIEEKAWDKEIIPRLQLIGEVFANALDRKKNDEKINQLLQRLEAENKFLQKEVKESTGSDEILGNSPEFKYILHQVKQIAPTTTPVLIMGETGTGKELIARAIHNASERKDRPFVIVNCAALPASMVERELFGHDKGAFTGAVQKQMGRFEFADGATIFLDEIGELPLELQPKLLRVLQDGEFERLGNPKTIKVDVRLISATNLDLEKEVKEGRFRRDLFYRINVFPLTMPALRDRKDDIPLLVTLFIKRLSQKMKKKFNTIPRQTMRKLTTYSWPGNIRELENLIERAVITSTEPDLYLHIPDQLNAEKGDNKTLSEIEKQHILHILKRSNWKIKGIDGAAEILGMKPSTLRDRMKKFGIEKPHLRI